ncbi:MAG: L,D-transpeptidase [Gemmatirosa sp.]
MPARQELAPASAAPCGEAPRGGSARDAGDPPSGLSLAINIPAFRLDVRDAATIRSYPVAVGLPKYPTPRGSFRVHEIVWNPRWVPPPSDWARDEHPRPPGSDNPMGRVKMRVTGLVFVHGTPLEGSLGSAASHACVRMANADAIAVARLVQRRALPELADAAIDSVLADSTRTRTFVLERQVPVIVRYELAEVLRDTLWLYPNVYALRISTRGAAMQALARAGVDTGAIDRATLGRAVRAARRRAVGSALADLAPPLAPADPGRP